MNEISKNRLSKDTWWSGPFSGGHAYFIDGKSIILVFDNGDWFLRNT